MSEHASHEDPDLAEAVGMLHTSGVIVDHPDGSVSMTPVVVDGSGNVVDVAKPPSEAGVPADILTPFLTGTDIDTPEENQRLREQLVELQAHQRVVLGYVEELEKLLKQANHLAGKLGDDCEAAGRACFDVWEEDEFLRGHLAGLGSGWMRGSRLLAFLANVLVVKSQRLKAETMGGKQ